MLDECSVAIQQMIAIARAVDMKCKVLILDEPTSSLDDEEVEKLFVLMRRLREEGVGIIFVTHFLEQVYAVCDRITVLRNGELVGEYETKDLPRVMLVAKMMGKDFDDLADIKGDHKDKKVFSELRLLRLRVLDIRERSGHLILRLIKERLSVLPVFWDPDVLNWYVPFTELIKLTVVH